MADPAYNPQPDDLQPKVVTAQQQLQRDRDALKNAQNVAKRIDRGSRYPILVDNVPIGLTNFVFPNDPTETAVVNRYGRIVGKTDEKSWMRSAAAGLATTIGAWYGMDLADLPTWLNAVSATTAGSLASIVEYSLEGYFSGPELKEGISKKNWDKEGRKTRYKRGGLHIYFPGDLVQVAKTNTQRVQPRIEKVITRYDDVVLQPDGSYKPVRLKGLVGVDLLKYLRIVDPLRATNFIGNFDKDIVEMLDAVVRDYSASTTLDRLIQQDLFLYDPRPNKRLRKNQRYAMVEDRFIPFRNFEDGEAKESDHNLRLPHHSLVTDFFRYFVTAEQDLAEDWGFELLMLRIERIVLSEQVQAAYNRRQAAIDEAGRIARTAAAFKDNSDAQTLRVLEAIESGNVAVSTTHVGGEPDLVNGVVRMIQPKD